MTPELRSRLIFGFTMSGLVIFAIASDVLRQSHLGVLILGIAGAVLGCLEFARLARVQATEVQSAPMIVVSVLLVLVGHLSGELRSSNPALSSTFLAHIDHLLTTKPVTMLIMGLGLAWVLLAQMFHHATTRFFSNVGATVLGMVYMGVVFHLLQRLALLEGTAEYYGTGDDYSGRGGQLVMLFLASCKLGDVTAYFGGKTFGRHKMVPKISPAKTWEGFFCSFIGAIGGAYLFAWLFTVYFPHGPFNGWWQPLVWGLILGPFGVAGDLAESCMKRDAAMKDSGKSLGGFGGFLDIYDALVLAAPVAYLLALVL
ncbi:MAG: phosphatidate cytidylyltransferase [Planctomycetes bacterium]|nr:phosphatidate cytidylyltransferase [Planctomycetota bacterium]